MQPPPPLKSRKRPMIRASEDYNRRPFAIADLNATIDGQPRMLDVTLAAALGFVRSLDIRPLIHRHISRLSRFGEVVSTVEKTSAKGGRPGKAYYLNKKQALYICTKSETENATEVTIQMVEVFDAYTSGKTVNVEAHTRRTSTKVEDAVRLKKNIDRLESVVTSLDAIQHTQPNFCAMVIDGEHVFVDINDYKVQPGDRAVVVDHAGAISINAVDPESYGFKPMGPRSALGPRYPTSHGGIARNTVMIVGKVLGGSVRDDRQRVVDDVSAQLRRQITTLLESGPWNDRQIASQLCCNPKLVREVRREQSRKPTDQLPRVGLARRTIEHDPGAVRYGEWIVPLIEKGYSNKMISKMLGCHEETVRRHRVRLVS